MYVFYATTGTTSSPSSTIYNVYVSYSTDQVCIGPVCSSLSRPTLLQTKVSFVDITQPPVEVLKSISNIQGQLPEDFFYPFFVASNFWQTTPIQTMYLLTLFVVVVIQ